MTKQLLGYIQMLETKTIRIESKRPVIFWKYISDVSQANGIYRPLVLGD
jgi:hypothetical protein